MKKLYLLALVAMTCGSQAVAQSNTKRQQSAKPKLISEKIMLSSDKNLTARQAIERLNAAEKSQEIWRAGREEAFVFIEGEWLPESTYDFQYNPAGFLTQEKLTDMDGFVSVTDYTLDANNQATEKVSYDMEGEEKLYTEKKVSKYDTKVIDFTTEVMSYTWQDTDWAESYDSFKRPVTRNADGNVTNFTVLSPDMSDGGTFKEIEKTDITYNETTKQADTFKFSSLQYDGTSLAWSLEWDIRDIEWENTDGQIVNTWEELILGNNRIKKVAVYYDGNLDGYTIAKYPVSGKQDFQVDETDNDGNVYVKHNLTTTDDYGSYREEYLYYFYDDDLTTLDASEYAIVKFNEKGDLLSAEQFMEEAGETIQMAGERYTYTYDATTGLATETLIEMYNSDETVLAYEPFLKIIRSNFIDAAGVGEITGTAAALSCSVSGNELRMFMPGMTGYAIYSVSGAMAEAGNAGNDNTNVNISSLAPGVYIVKAVGTNGAASKKFIKR